MTYSIDTLQECVTQDIKCHSTSRLYTTIDHTVTSICEAQILLLNSKLVVTHGECDNWKLVRGCGAGKGVTLLRLVVGRAGDGIVDGLAGGIRNQSESRSRVSNSGVTRLIDGFAVDGGGGGVKHPEPLRVVDRCVCDILTGGRHSVLVNVAESVKALPCINIIGIAPAAETHGEELGGLRNVLLGDHILDGCLNWGRGDGIDAAPGKAEESVSSALYELR